MGTERQVRLLHIIADCTAMCAEMSDHFENRNLPADIRQRAGRALVQSIKVIREAERQLQGNAP